MLYKRISFHKKRGIVNPVDGDLLVLNGQTVNIAEGSIKQYKSIQIDAGGILQITGTTGAWTEIGCSGNCIVNGQIIARAGYDGTATHNGGTFTKSSAFGLGNLSYTIAQQNGGAGANGSFVSATAGIGGSQANGIGGGGAGGGPGGNGGAGGQNGTSSGSYPGGTGGGLGNGGNSVNDGSNAYPIGGNGASGGGGGGYTPGGVPIPKSLGGGTTSEVAYGGGGAGAYKGHHGKGLVLYVEGSLSGTGSVICSGRAGFVGGAGVDYSGTGGADGGGGGGGGGGAGGSGGSLILKYGSLVSTPSVSVSGGAGGAGGAGNNAAGASGSSGLNGTYSLSKI